MPHKFTTLKDVALKAQTTVATASFVLNGSKNRYITAELRDRVEKAAQELNYVKHGAAGSLKGKKTGIIAFISPQYGNHYFSDIFVAIEQILHENGYVLATLNTFDDANREKYAINQMTRLRVDGLLIIPTIGGGTNTEHIRTLDIPFVAVERPINGVCQDEYDFISSDNFGATYALTKHALECGHRNIALAYWESDISMAIYNLKDRKAGYLTAMQEYGIDGNPLIFGGDILREEGARITASILKEKNEEKNITAIVYSHYILAEGGIQYLRKKGIRIPDDISVLFLGAPYWTGMSEIDFTHVIQPGAEIGRQAAMALIDRIDGHKRENLSTVIPAKFHKGESVLRR